jgi:TonB family protein
MKLHSAIAVTGIFLGLASCSLVLVQDLSAQAPDAIEGQIQKQYAGNQRILRKFYDSNHLKYDAAGNYMGKATIGSWTLFGNVLIERVSLTDQALTLEGHRNILVFSEDGKRMQNKKSDRWLAEIATHRGPDQGRQIAAALRNVFLAEGEDLAAILPDYWQDYVQRLNGRGAGERPCPSSRASAAEANADPQTGKHSAGLLDGRKIHDVQPSYLMVARQAGVQGEIRLRAVINKSGDIAELCLTQALGGGLDDEVARVVRQWKYQPYLLNGEPVEVETIVTMKFGMRN